MRRTGSTQQRLAEECPILGAKFWKKDRVIQGKVVRKFPTRSGDCYEIMLTAPQTIAGSECFPVKQGNVVASRVGIGAMKGFLMALAQVGRDPLQPGDPITVRCTGSQKSGKGSDMVLFEVEVDY